MRHDPRIARLRIEQGRLINLVKRSEFIDIEEIHLQAGWPPEKYKVTFTCRGIAKINKLTLAPEAANFHQVLIYLSHDFPRQAPHMQWLTPIWHPNIEHEEPRHVCANDTQNWHAAKSLYDLVLSLGEMIQYKWYHAVWKDPWPLDREAAKWVVEYAEPRGILGRNKPFDNRPLLRPYEIRLWDKVTIPNKPASPTSPQGKTGIKIGVRRHTGEFKTNPSPEGNSNHRRITLGAVVKRVVCPECGRENRLQVGDNKREFFCGNCKTKIPTSDAFPQ